MMLLMTPFRLILGVFAGRFALSASVSVLLYFLWFGPLERSRGGSDSWFLPAMTVVRWLYLALDVALLVGIYRLRMRSHLAQPAMIAFGIGLFCSLVQAVVPTTGIGMIIDYLNLIGDFAGLFLLATMLYRLSDLPRRSPESLYLAYGVLGLQSLYYGVQRIDGVRKLLHQVPFERVFHILLVALVCGAMILLARAAERSADQKDDKGDPLAPDAFVRVSTTDNGTRNMIVGGLWFVGGLAVTLISYQSASQGSGGRYVVAYGAVIFGLVQFIRGVIQASAATAKRDE